LKKVPDIESRAMLLLAHAGHWLPNVIMFLPVFVFGIWLAAVTVRDRRRRER
jgi:hypothetical protein